MLGEAVDDRAHTLSKVTRVTFDTLITFGTTYQQSPTSPSVLSDSRRGILGKSNHPNVLCFSNVGGQSSVRFVKSVEETTRDAQKKKKEGQTN